ncbi:hypothetical protein BC628DRAFT_1330161 [Trametes gibbosa]|nr:hypothetical protein BC628DRAFT_1330161 [Trametes gibbosa]
MDKVINVSSPENSPGQDAALRATRVSRARSRQKRPFPQGAVIELSDSDSEEFPMNISQSQPSRSLKKVKVRAEPAAGPSHRRGEPSAAAVPPPLAIYPQARRSPPCEQLPPMPVPQQAPLEAQDNQHPFKLFVAQILEIIPDVLPAHVYSLVEQHYPNYLDKVVEPVLHQLIENPQYPKVAAKGKEKRKHDDENDQATRSVKAKIDYGSKDRKVVDSPHYAKLAWERLMSDFPNIPTAHIRDTWTQHRMFYAPTFLALRQHQTLQPLPYKPISRPRPKGKGKAVDHFDEEFERELGWVQETIEEEETKKAVELAEKRRMQEEGGIECGCCFCEYPFEKMVQCPEAHLFCMSCMNTYTETKLGEHDLRIVCMDQSGCKLPFPDSELRRFLSPKLLELYERVKQCKEIEAAGLENLEECPFCDYKVVIENENERLFRCENKTCGAVTCRQCKKPDHLPKSCQEVANDKKLDVRHAIEEAMTAALMRNCPKCQKAFVKEMGCNKMTCPNCGALSCYVCRQLIHGYEHFGNPPPYTTAKADPTKCPLWDSSVEGRHSDEVTAAAKAAIEEYKRTHPELDEKDLKVDLPAPPPAAASVSRAGVRAHAHAHLPMPQVYWNDALQRFGAGRHVQMALFEPALPALPRLPNQARHAVDREREQRADLVPARQRHNLDRHEARAARRRAAAAIHAMHRAPAPIPMPLPAAAPALPPAPAAVHNVHVHIHHNLPPHRPAAHPAPAPHPHVWFQAAPMHVLLQAQPPILPPALAPGPAILPAIPMDPAPLALGRADAHVAPPDLPIRAQRRSKRAEGRQ